MLQSIISTRPIIHLSFFTGIGVSQLALQYLHTNTVITSSWEIDPFCNELLDHHYQPHIQHMGDIADTDFDTFCQELAANYDTTHIILTTSAPPCKDHSRVRDTPPGLSGEDGSLLQQMTNIHLTIRQRLPQHTIRSLMENVLPHHTIKSLFDNISRQLGYHPLIVDAADGHITSRPRLWWLDADWQHITQHLTRETPWTLHWTQQDDYDKLHNPIATLMQPPVHVKDWETPAILCQQQLFHCLTTQAPTDLGRPPPQHAKADNSTWDRWQQDNRQFPPWQYQPQFLTRKHEGDWQPITPLQRERIMALPDHYIHKKLQQQRVDPHWRLMAEEIATEVQQGRMAGPFHGPQWLHHSTTPLLEFEHASTLQPLPHADPIIAMAFSIEQTGSTARPKSDEERTGDAPVTTKHARSQTNHITTHQITTPGLPSTPADPPKKYLYSVGSRPRWSIQTTPTRRPIHCLCFTPHTIWSHTMASPRTAITTVSATCSQPSPALLPAYQWYTTSMITDPSNRPRQPNQDSPPSNNSIPSSDFT